MDNLLSGAANRLRKIQRADDGVKKKYLIVLCSICMLFIIGLWAIYLNLNIPSLIPIKEKASVENNENSFWATLSRGSREIASDLGSQIATTIDSTKKTFNNLKSRAQETNEYSFYGDGKSFLFVDEDPVPKTIINLAK
ncbi:MAG: hypothetical protein AAB617_02105 [Patescibacteria group bacterium]